MRRVGEHVAMPKAVFLVQSQASSPDREDEYHKWYENTHIPQLCEIPGIKSARRFTLAGGGFGPADAALPAHLAIYEFESDDLDAVLNEIVTRTGDGRIEMSDAIQLDPPPMTLLYVEREPS
jgi:hypothetical protein